MQSTVFTVLHAGPSSTRADPSQSSTPQVADVTIHNAFSAECGAYFVWQTLGLVYSFEQSGQPGRLTRLLSCTGAAKSYPHLCQIEMHTAVLITSSAHDTASFVEACH